MHNISTIIAYGQSGAGKTFTINRLINSVIKDLFGPYEVKEIKCSYFQIYYNEKIYDLILKNSKGQRYKHMYEDLKLKLMHDNHYAIQGLSLHKCTSSQQLLKLKE